MCCSFAHALVFCNAKPGQNGLRNYRSLPVSELATFFNMGGYAMYVWPSMALTFFVLLANVWFSKRQLKKVLRETAIRSKAHAQKKAERHTDDAQNDSVNNNAQQTP